MDTTLSVHEAAAAADLARIDDGLEAHNRREAALADVRGLDVVARTSAGVVIGGAIGRTWGGCCELLQLWVDAPVRGRGLGDRLMAAFEAEAAGRGCSLVYLSTFSFQAPGFYAKRGYAVVLETAGFTGGVVKFMMQKTLGPAPGRRAPAEEAPMSPPAPPPIATLAAWHALVQARDYRGLDALLADEVVFHSPVVHSPQAGKALTRQYLAAALQVFGNPSFRYLRELAGPRDAVLEFQVEIDGITVNGVDMLRWDDGGRITEFKVMVRPLKAIQLIQQRMAALLQTRAQQQ